MERGVEGMNEVMLIVSMVAIVLAGGSAAVSVATMLAMRNLARQVAEFRPDRVDIDRDDPTWTTAELKVDEDDLFVGQVR